MAQVAVGATIQQQSETITKYQWMVLIGAMLGWGLDGLDGNLYALVVQPVLKDLLPGATPAQIGYWGGMAVSFYLVGWSLGGIVFGLMADLYGRIRILTISILIYSVFTAATAFAQSVWQLAAFRFLTGFGSGVEWAIGAAMIAETWNNRYRAKASAFMMSAFAIGFFLASLVYRLVGPFGWRAVFLVGLVPALSAFWIRKHLEEPASFTETQQKRAAARAGQLSGATAAEFARNPIAVVFSGSYLRHTIVCIVMSAAALIAFWAIGAWIPTVAREVLGAQGMQDAELLAKVSYASMAYNAGGFFGYASWGFIGDRLRRIPTFAINLGGMVVFGWLVFLYARDFIWLLVGLFVMGYCIMGFFGGNAVYFPELYPPRVRATAITLINNTARFLTAAGPFATGLLVAQFGSFAKAAAAISLVGLLGLAALPFAKETHGQPLPE